MSNEAPERLWVRMTLLGGTISYVRDPREDRDDGRPVYEYALLPPVSAAQMENQDGLPAIAGRRCLCTLAELEQRARLLIRDEQEKPLPDNSLIDVLCNAVRLAREQCDMVRAPILDSRPAAEREEELRPTRHQA